MTESPIRSESTSARIALEIWKACGEPEAMPRALPVEARAIGAVTAEEAETAGRKAYEEASRG